MTEHIEAFKEDHLDECAQLLMVTFNTEPWNDNWTLDRAKKALAWTLRVPGFVGLVTLDDGIAGFATGYREPDDVRDVFYLNTFCVKPDVQGRGVGSRLLEHLKAHLEESGVNTIYLITNRGTPAEAFYKKNGYTVNSKDIVMTCEW
jgi:aminoglycoside 6'-N-acetyltransferase I